MCGIAGVHFKRRPNADDFQRFSSAARLMHHRGPDAYGEYVGDRVMLIHYRLSIIDLSDRANQPYKDPAGDGSTVFNGEIYNFRELASDYALQMDTSSDTEVLCRLFNTKRSDCLSELNGIFAFAHWNPLEQKLFLARDRFGVKPLYYVDNDEFFAFASEAKVLYSFLSKFKINRKVLSEFLWFGSSIGDETLVAGVQKVPPGHYLEYSASIDALRANSFWSVAENIVPRCIGRENHSRAIETTRRLLEESVERQCVSDVPVGAYLSGGIDSSIIVALAAQHLGSRLDTFSVAFDSTTESELPLAKLVAERYKTNHHEVHASGEQFEETLSQLVFQYDEPFADPAALPLFLLATSNQTSTKVVLQGDGADEIFGGYGRHLDTSQFWRRRIAFLLASTWPGRPNKRRVMWNRGRQLWASPPWRRSALLVSGIPNASPERILSEQFHRDSAESDAFEKYRQVDLPLASLTPLQRMLYADAQIILPNTYLEKVDKVSMMHSIEARVPYLDNNLTDYIMRLPGNLKLRYGRTKFLLRESCKDLLPSEVLHAKKVSFGTPMGAWLRGPLYEYAKSIIASSKKSSAWLIDTDFVDRLLDQHRAGGVDHSYPIWRAVVLLLWLERYSGKLT